MQKQVFIPKNQFIATKTGIGTIWSSIEPHVLTRPDGDLLSEVTIQRIPVTAKSHACVEISTTDFMSLTVTEDTKLATQRGLIAAGDIVEGDQIKTFLSDTTGDLNFDALSDIEKEWHEFHHTSGRVMGYFLGHGTIRVGTSQYRSKRTGLETQRVQGQYLIHLSHAANPDKESLSDLSIHHPLAIELTSLFETSMRSFIHTQGQKITTFTVPRKFWSETFWKKSDAENWSMYQPMAFLRSFIRSYFTADVNFQPNRMRLPQSDLPHLQKIKILLARFGIYSKIIQHGNKSGVKTYSWKHKDGTVTTGPRKDAYFLIIDGVDLINFRDRIGLDDDWKGKKAKLDTAIEVRKTMGKGLVLTGTSIVSSVKKSQKMAEKAVLSASDAFESVPVSINGFKCYF